MLKDIFEKALEAAKKEQATIQSFTYYKESGKDPVMMINGKPVDDVTCCKDIDLLNIEDECEDLFETCPEDESLLQDLESIFGGDDQECKCSCKNKECGEHCACEDEKCSLGSSASNEECIDGNKIIVEESNADEDLDIRAFVDATSPVTTVFSQEAQFVEHLSKPWTAKRAIQHLERHPDANTKITFATFKDPKTNKNKTYTILVTVAEN